MSLPWEGFSPRWRSPEWTMDAKGATKSEGNFVGAKNETLRQPPASSLRGP
jgi:hypothetical protein